MTTCKTTRRAILAGAAAIPAAMLVPAIPALTAPAIAEKPELLALGEQIDPLLNAYLAANERKKAARVLAEKLCLPLPDELICSGPDRAYAGHLTEAELDIEDKRLELELYRDAAGKEWARPDRQIFKSNLIREYVEDHQIGPRTKDGRHLRALLKIAEEYEASRRAAIAASGLDDAVLNADDAASRVEDLAWEVRKIEPNTVAGIVIFARSIEAHVEVAQCGKTVFGQPLASAILRIAGHGELGMAA